MATWAKGIDFKNSANTARVGGLGIYGTDTKSEKIYLGLGSEPWNNSGLELTSSAISFKGNKVYHAGSKPTPAEIGAASSSHTHNYAGSSSAGGAATTALACSGNSATATTLATARTINGTSFNGSANITTANWGTARTITIGSTGKSVNGSSNVSWSLAEIGAAAASHTHSYLPLSGGTMTGKITTSANTGTYLAGNQGGALINSTSSAGTYTMLYRYPSTNGYFTTGGYQGNYLLQYTAKTTVDAGTNGVTKSVTLLNESGNSSFPGTVSAPTFSGTLSGNASTATTLQTARTINGTSFNGSANITTANWGTARTITIGNTGKSVNGSAAVSWSLSEIGAIGAVSENGYWGMTHPDKTTSGFIRTTTSGIIPYQSGGASSLGTSSWPFNNIYGKNTISTNITGDTTNSNVYKLRGASNGSFGYYATDGDVYIASYDNHWLRLKQNESLTYAGRYVCIAAWGTSAPSGSDGRPIGTVYFRY